MRRAIRQVFAQAVECFDPGGPVVELGARYEPGYAWLSDLRPLFQGREYIGCDIRQGPGVDRIENAESLTFADGSVGTLVLCEILEHLRHPQRALAEARRVLRPDGLLLLSVPFLYRLHGFPSDYWRFTRAGVHVLLEAFGARVVCDVGPRHKPAFAVAAASPSAHHAFRAGEQRFRNAVGPALATTRWRGFRSALAERARDLAGLLLGRAELGVRFFDPDEPDRYGAAPVEQHHEGSR